MSEISFTVLGTNAAAIAVGMLVLWALSIAIRDASIVDIAWGLGFAAVAGLSFAQGAGSHPRQILCALLTAIWGVRLGGYLAWRNLGHGEDKRYQAMRRRHDPGFELWSLYAVFGLQGSLMWLVSLPVQVAASTPAAGALGGLDALAIALWSVGFAFESVGDWQLARFKADPANAGQVMDRGLWAWTRHPNYFGDALVWWGLFAFALATPGGAWTIVGPIAMTFLLRRVSGVALLERGLARSKPGWLEYAARTPAFLPRPPRRKR